MGWKKGNDCLYSACVGEEEMTNHNHTGLWRDSICHCFSFVLRKAGCLSSVSVCVCGGGGGQWGVNALTLLTVCILFSLLV